MNKKITGQKNLRINKEQEDYHRFYTGVEDVLEYARHMVVSTANAIMTATYWEIGRRIVEFEQEGKARATYGAEVIKRLSGDLKGRFGRGFGVDNLQRFRTFYLAYPQDKIYATLSRISDEEGGKGKYATVSRISALVNHQDLKEVIPLEMAAQFFPLPWSAYVRLLSVKNEQARCFYETEALRGGWSVRQLNRQIESQFYERTALSKNKAAMLTKGKKTLSEDRITPEEAIKDPYLLEFLQLRDEYSESDLEEALIQHLEAFLLELGGGFCFVGRQKRLRIGDEWYRVDLLFFHRTLRCLVIIDLKLGKLTHAATGQMHLYLNYAAEHWTQSDENPPVGLILCAQKNEALAKYALHNLPNKVMAAEYKTVLPDEEMLIQEIEQTRKKLDSKHPQKKILK